MPIFDCHQVTGLIASSEVGYPARLVKFPGVQCDAPCCARLEPKTTQVASNGPNINALRVPDSEFTTNSVERPNATYFREMRAAAWTTQFAGKWSRCVQVECRTLNLRMRRGADDSADVYECNSCFSCRSWFIPRQKARWSRMSNHQGHEKREAHQAGSRNPASAERRLPCTTRTLRGCPRWPSGWSFRCWPALHWHGAFRRAT